VVFPFRPGLRALGELPPFVLAQSVHADRRERDRPRESSVLGGTRRSDPPTR
jgi:hypothetical protein